MHCWTIASLLLFGAVSSRRVGLIVDEGKTCLMGGETMNKDDYMLAPAGHVQLTMQSDGNLVVYGHDNPNWCWFYWCTYRARWATNTVGQGNVFENHMNGNLILWRGDGQWAWSSGTVYNAPKHLCIQDDGNLVLYNQDQYSDRDAVWATNTDYN